MAEPARLWWVNQFARALADGGGTRQVEMGRALRSLGWDTTIIASDFDLYARKFIRRTDPDDRRPVEAVEEGVAFRWLWGAPYVHNDWRRAWNWGTFAWSVAREQPAATARPDVLIGSSPQPFAALMAERLARRLQVPFVFEVRDLWPESLVAAGSRPGVMYHLVDRVARHLYRNARRIVVLAEGVQDYLVRERGVPAERIAFIPNGVDVSAFELAQPRAHDGFVLAYAGAHGPMNGLDIVIEAAALLKDLPDLRIELIGDGPAKPALRAQAEAAGARNVVFKDIIPKADMPRYMAGVDGGLMVLRNAELFAFGVSPNKLFDYFGAAIPVISNVPGEVGRWLARAQAGIQADGPSAESLAQAIRALHRLPPATRAAMGQAGREWVRQNHDRQLLAARLDGVLRPLISGRSSA